MNPNTKAKAKGVLDLFKDSYAEFSRDNAMRLSAALSYYSIFSIAPLLLIAVGIAGRIFGQKAAEGRVASELSQFVGAQAAQALQSILQSASQHSGGATVIGFATLFVGAASVFGQLKDSLNTIWKVRPKPHLPIWFYLRQYLFSFGMVLCVGFLLLVSLVLSTLVTGLTGWLEHHLGVPPAASVAAGFVAPFVVEVLLFAVIFRVLPDADIPWRTVWVGAAFTAVLFEIGKIGLAFYLGRGSATSSFGAAGSVVLLLLWVYYASCILFFGSEYTVVYAREHGVDVKPSHYAEWTEIWTPEGRLPAECAPTSAAGAKAAPVRRPGEAEPVERAEPLRETLLPLLFPDSIEKRREEPAASEEPKPQSKLAALVEQANRHPAAEMGAAVGAGLFAGILLRFVDRRAMR